MTTYFSVPSFQKKPSIALYLSDSVQCTVSFRITENDGVQLESRKRIHVHHEIEHEFTSISRLTKVIIVTSLTAEVVNIMKGAGKREANTDDVGRKCVGCSTPHSGRFV